MVSEDLKSSWSYWLTEEMYKRGISNEHDEKEMSLFSRLDVIFYLKITYIYTYIVTVLGIDWIPSNISFYNQIFT